MSSLVLGECTTSSASGHITGLSNIWSYTYYLAACIKVTYGGTTITSNPYYPTGSGYDTQEMTVNGTFTAAGIYSVLARVQAANGTWYDAGTGTFTVLDTPGVSVDPDLYHIDITLSAVSGADTYYANISGGSWQSGSGRSFTFSGLDPDTLYTIGFVCGGAGYLNSPSGSINVRTDTLPSYTVTINYGTGVDDAHGAGTYVAGSTCTLTADVNSAYVFDGWYRNNIFVSDDNPFSYPVNANSTFVVMVTKRLDTPGYTATKGGNPPSITITLDVVNGADTYYANISGGAWQSSPNRSFTFNSGLALNTGYSVGRKCTGAGYPASLEAYVTLYTAISARPDDWSWSVSNGNASDLQTQYAYNAITHVAGYDISDFSYLVWNDLVDKVDAFCVYQNKSITNTNARMPYSGSALTATRFNYLLTAIHQIVSTGITNPQSPGDIVRGWYFTTIANTLNNIT